MTTSAINAAFEAMIAQRGIHEKIGLSSTSVRQYRYQLKNGVPISYDTKLKLLKLSGWKEDDTAYTRTDLVALAKFVLKQGSAAKEHGPEYIVQKFLNKR